MYKDLYIFLKLHTNTLVRQGEVLEPGQQVNVKILGIDEENERVSLSIKATLPNEDVVESDPSTTKAYLENEEEDNPTIGDMIGDKLKKS